MIVAWHIAHGFVVIPKSSRRERIVANAAGARIELTTAEVAAIDGLSAAARVGSSRRLCSRAPLSSSQLSLSSARGVGGAGRNASALPVAEFGSCVSSAGVDDYAGIRGGLIHGIEDDWLNRTSKSAAQALTPLAPLSRRSRERGVWWADGIVAF